MRRHCKQALSVLLVLLACVCCSSKHSSELNNKKPLVLLISIDGFRPDYLQRGLSPTLNKLASNGAVSEGLISSFPSVTFPNHYTIVTGLTPDHHGIVNNRMYDPQIPDQVFHYSSPEAVHNPQWWEGGTPIWVTAKQQGKKTATMFWPGSETLIQGLRADDWLVYQHDMSSLERVNQLLQWLDKPEKQRADFATLYFSEVDSVGHKKGPNSTEVDNAIKRVDDAISELLKALDERKLLEMTSFVIVSDHGMTYVPESHIINVKSLIKAFPDAKVQWTGAYAGIAAKPDNVDAILSTLANLRHLSCWKKSELPARFDFGEHRRVPAIFCLAEQGWFVSKYGKDLTAPVLGMHGYDPALQDMQGLFIASGYRIKQLNSKLKQFENVDVYPLLVELLGIHGEAHDGDQQLLELIDK